MKIIIWVVPCWCISSCVESVTAPNSIIWIESSVAGVEWSVGNRMVRLSSGYLYLFIREFEESLEKPTHQRIATQHCLLLFWDENEKYHKWLFDTFLIKVLILLKSTLFFRLNMALYRHFTILYNTPFLNCN